MSIKLSIIIPSYNRYPLNLCSLYSLENQTVSAKDIEILFIDDCSTDKTSYLRHYESRYKFTYIRNLKNKGRAASRNIGIAKAKGELLLFLDAEMMVEPDFLQNHIDHHHHKNRLVVCGTFYHMGVFTMYYPDFSTNQVNHIYRLAHNHSIPLPTFKRKEAFPIIKKEDIDSLNFKKLSFHNPYFSEIANAFGDDLEGYGLPWTVFLSGNVSLKKDFLLKTGGFDENFKGWGFEDWELGYRLFKNGARIISRENIKAYHQEHPVPQKFIKFEMLPNFYLFQKKHQTFEVSIHVLFLLGLTSRLQENLIVKEYHMLIRDHPNKFLLLIEVFLNGLDYFAAELASVPFKLDQNLLQQRIKLRNQKIEILKLGKYSNFLHAFNLVTKKMHLQ
ncbi:glycosyltransferase family 2 protein [Bacillus sp. NEB1478]|uniref:glycosyltransferase family 2 protein n=1 Tax=Bacillus sp. NEB1478 TaxID=3073816 RepID=UPI00287340A4|nr:glycosyltransferase family 2 protein [Bacillus sp. NEB1478]WNB90299.1 glycosyltransferase family 2 protein [Bacillus sp. NEB1478]